MDYERMLRRAWDIVWNNKFLILLGILVVLGSGGGGGSGSGGGGGGGGAPGAGRLPEGEYVGPASLEEGLEDVREVVEEFAGLIGLGVALICALIIVFFIIGLALWVVATISRGGLIAGVDQIETVGASSLGQAWSASWQRGWRMIGIALIPAIPNLVMLIVFLGLLGAFFASMGGFSAEPEVLFRGLLANAGLMIALVAVVCVGGIINLALGILKPFANRACILEDTRVFESYSRGWQILRDNLGFAVLLFLLQAAIHIVLFIILIIPSILMALCCLFWPVLLAISGTITAYFSTLWTLAWRHWTGREPGEMLVAEEAPAV